MVVVAKQRSDEKARKWREQREQALRQSESYRQSDHTTAKSSPPPTAQPASFAATHRQQTIDTDVRKLADAQAASQYSSQLANSASIKRAQQQHAFANAHSQLDEHRGERAANNFAANVKRVVASGFGMFRWIPIIGGVMGSIAHNIRKSAATNERIADTAARAIPAATQHTNQTYADATRARNAYNQLELKARIDEDEKRKARIAAIHSAAALPGDGSLGRTMK